MTHQTLSELATEESESLQKLGEKNNCGQFIGLLVFDARFIQAIYSDAILILDSFSEELEPVSVTSIAKPNEKNS